MDHQHTHEDVIQTNLDRILNVSEGKETATIEEVSAAFQGIRTRVEEILEGECGEECKSEMKGLARHLESLRNAYLATTSGTKPYPDWGRVRLLAQQVLANPNFEDLYILLHMTDDCISTQRRELGDVFALEDAIHALEQHWTDYRPDSFEESREKWDEPGYCMTRALQWQLLNRTWLVPLYKEILETRKKDPDQLGMYRKHRSIL